ncbi:DUF4062 domain-containing protein [Desulfurivibrio sp. D14AmB]|uniref:DUF4062 domain-containing protein n=1 Tax=Desulfurivibrio sp. D14AmB TaxID=3374370 RepID=UPI00376F3917
MPYNATVINIMIASPGDVATERNVIRTAIHGWNAVHSADRAVILAPVGWDTHSAPEMGDRAQAVINKQVLQNCDLLVAVFWTRLGSPTGKVASGTVEEIEEHLRAGKPAMLYFSNAPVHPDSVDDAQYKALRDFRAACQKRGLVETYDSLEEFREKFWRQLAQTIIREYGSVGTSQADPALFAAPSGPRLSDTAKQLLLEAAQDRNGVVMCVRMMGGLIVQTNGKQLAEKGDPRSEARWKSAIEELMNFGLMEARGHKGEVFGLTNEAYQLSDQLGGGMA